MVEKYLELQCCSKKVLARPMGTPYTKVALLEQWTSITNPAVLNHWLGLVKGKLGLCLNIIVDPEGQQLGPYLSQVCFPQQEI